MTKITRIETFTVRVPGKEYIYHGNLEISTFPHVILKVSTDEGIVGLGEAHAWPYLGLPEEELGMMSDYFIGKDPLKINLQAICQISDTGAPTRSGPAFEMALYDLVGKLRGVPVWQLFGGRFRDRVPITYCMGDKSAEDAAKEAEEAAKRGFKAIKMKGFHAENDAARIKAVAEAAGPEVQVRVDANTGWERPAVVVELAKQLEGYSIESFESPMPQWNLDAYAMLRQQIDIPIMLHLSEPFEIINAIKKEACDCINFGEVASFNQVRTAAAIAETAGIPMELGSGYDFGIGDTATAHVAAATRNVTLPSDLVGNFLHEDDLIVEPIRIKDGCIELSEKPGLGIELDEEAVEKYTVRKSSYPADI